MAIGAYHFIVAMGSAWVSREQAAVLEYLREENKVLLERLGGKRLRLSDAQRRRLARKGQLVGRRGLRELGCIVTPQTILRWHRQLLAAKYDGSKRQRGLGRPRAGASPSRGSGRNRSNLGNLGPPRPPRRTPASRSPAHQRWRGVVRVTMTASRPSQGTAAQRP